MKRILTSIAYSYYSINQKTGKREYNYLLLFGSISFLAILITILYGLVVINMTIGENDERGTFGDMFGALNSIFSGLTIAGIIITILIQKQELNLTREELIRSANAQEQTQKALFDQLKSMQTTTRINAFQDYMTTEFDMSDSDANDKQLTSERSFINEVENLLLSKSNWKNYCPKLKINSIKLSSVNTFQQVAISNIGSKLKIQDFNYDILAIPSHYRHHFGRDLNTGASMHFFIKQNREKNIFSFIFKCYLTNERFSQEVLFTMIDGGYSWTQSEPLLLG